MNFEISILQEYVSLAKDTFSILSSILLVIIAFLGLQTWKRQLKGNTEYELARRLLRSVYKVRDAIQFVRNPFASAGEIQASLDVANIKIQLTDPNFQATSQAALYKRRWKRVEEALRELDLEIFEAEAIWGPEIYERLEIFKNLITKLFVSIEQYLKRLQRSDDFDLSSIEKIDKIIYSFEDLHSIENDNSYSAEVYSSIANIEELIKPRLHL